MGISASVIDGQLVYNYTDKAAEKKASGANLGYDQFLQLLCAEMQHQDPLEPTTNTDYVAQLATFSQLEATLNMDSTQKSSMANSLVGKEVILKTTTASGSTGYVQGRVDYVMYQDGEIFLSVNDGLYSIDDLDTVADAEYYEAVTSSKTFSNMMSALPEVENLTLIYKNAIQEIRDLYDGLTSYQQQFINPDEYAKLEEYEKTIRELEEVAENVEAGE